MHLLIGVALNAGAGGVAVISPLDKTNHSSGGSHAARSLRIPAVGASILIDRNITYIARWADNTYMVSRWIRGCTTSYLPRPFRSFEYPVLFVCFQRLSTSSITVTRPELLSWNDGFLGICASLSATTVTHFWFVAFAACVKFTRHLTGKATVLHPNLLKSVMIVTLAVSRISQ